MKRSRKNPPQKRMRHPTDKKSGRGKCFPLPDFFIERPLILFKFKDAAAAGIDFTFILALREGKLQLVIGNAVLFVQLRLFPGDRLSAQSGFLQGKLFCLLQRNRFRLCLRLGRSRSGRCVWLSGCFLGALIGENLPAVRVDAVGVGVARSGKQKLVDRLLPLLQGDGLEGSLCSLHTGVGQANRLTCSSESS